MATRLTLIGGPYDGDTREVADDYGVNGVVIPENGRTHIYRHSWDRVENGVTLRQCVFTRTIKATIPRRKP
jgi:hypothetical protein